MRPMGHCIGIVYRSWAFLQRQVSMRNIALETNACGHRLAGFEDLRVTSGGLGEDTQNDSMRPDPSIALHSNNITPINLSIKVLEEFETDDGIPYWFDRRTGETFWERPLCPEEKACLCLPCVHCSALFICRALQKCAGVLPSPFLMFTSACLARFYRKPHNVETRQSLSQRETQQ